MGSDNCVTVEIFMRVDKFLAQKKPTNNHPKFGMCFMESNLC
jgi:hypothetical protein